VTTYTIGETADRTGFSASTLRYYEGIGLAGPAARTSAGYRLYDEDGIARLAFVARAKQLGCTLEEIGDLIDLWDGGPCGPVQRRLHDLVTTKLAAAEAQIADLTMLTTELRAVADVLDGPPIDGDCGPACACTTIAPPVRRPLAGGLS
jgi:DNA-binding transcriptional MerR regulator